jgi:hypothetical protein
LLLLQAGWLLLASSCTGLLASGLLVHRHLLLCVGQPLAGQRLEEQQATETGRGKVPAAASQGPAAAGTGCCCPAVVPNGASGSWRPQTWPLLQRVYCRLAQLPWPLRLLASLLLVPALAVLLDLSLVGFFLWQLPLALFSSCTSSQAAPRAYPSLLLGCLVPGRCFVMRSLVTVVFQSSTSIAFTTWGYVVTRKYGVGKLITQVRPPAGWLDASCSRSLALMQLLAVLVSSRAPGLPQAAAG